MRGITITETDGSFKFVAHQCEFCALDSLGNHAWNCPNKNMPTEFKAIQISGGIKWEAHSEKD